MFSLWNNDHVLNILEANFYTNLVLEASFLRYKSEAIIALFNICVNIFFFQIKTKNLIMYNNKMKKN
jgi:hypothetical protein